MEFLLSSGAALTSWVYTASLWLVRRGAGGERADVFGGSRAVPGDLHKISWWAVADGVKVGHEVFTGNDGFQAAHPYC
jgi:hypothetical protein